MKATDLMIGDWVLLNGNPLKIQAIDSLGAEIVANGDLFCIKEDRWAYTADKIDSIPLTPEILEKNGFVFDSDFWTISNPRYNNVRMVRYCSIDEEVTDAFLGHWAFDENYAIDYVHELQHALRLCGLNELANNFKV